MTLEAGVQAPDFSLKGIDGREYRLSEALRAGPALLVFFKSTCGTCDVAFPYLNRLHETYKDGWQLWAVAQDGPEAAAEYARRLALGYPVLPDAPDYAISRLYDPPATPTLYLIDRDGRVAYTTHGFAKDDMNELARLLAERLGAQPRVIAPPDDGQPAFKPG